MNITAHVNSSPQKVHALQLAEQLGQQAMMLSRSGDHSGAEQLHLQILQAKIVAFGPDSPEVALTRNSLGEEQLELGKLDEAEENLRKAAEIRNNNSRVGAFDAAVTRENLAHVLEARGDLEGAKEVRRSQGTQNIACSYFKCPGQSFSISQLKTCGRCHSALYCSRDCQARDWRTRHKNYCK
ncbi:hypothetical protein FRC03_012181 [Tulasnella sp. 419]|nr:hypothetical protein FRC03_012181 [Tulasnella sp. 419]